MFYIAVWLSGALALAALLGAAGARRRADDAYDLAERGMENHHAVAEDLAEHHDRLVVLEPSDAANDESYGGTDSEEFPLL